MAAEILSIGKDKFKKLESSWHDPHIWLNKLIIQFLAAPLLKNQELRRPCFYINQVLSD